MILTLPVALGLLLGASLLVLVGSVIIFLWLGRDQDPGKPPRRRPVLVAWPTSASATPAEPAPVEDLLPTHSGAPPPRSRTHYPR